MRGKKKKFWSGVLLQTIILFVVVRADANVLYIGGLFETDDATQELSFHKALKAINADMSILPDVKLEAFTRIIPPQDSFRALRTACEFFNDENGVLAMISPRSASNAGVLGAACDALGIPLLQTHWVPRSRPRSLSLSLFPESSTLATAFAHFIDAHSWKSFTLIFQDNEALIRLQEILQFPTRDNQPQIKISLRHAKPEQDFKKLMKDLEKLGEVNFVVDLPLHRVQQLFADAKEVEMMTAYQNYLLTSLDVHTLDWSNKPYIGKTNITAFRLIDPENPKFKNFLSEWISSEHLHGKDVPSKQPITTAAALLYDAILMLTDRFDQLDRVNRIVTNPLQCNSINRWDKGPALANAFKFNIRGEFYGTSGSIRLDDNGLRTHFTLDVVKVSTRGIMKVASWDKENKFQYQKQDVDGGREVLDMLRNSTLKVTAVLTEPYLMKVEPAAGKKGNDLYKGYSRDLLDVLSAKFGFKYIITPEKDSKHGNPVNGVWNGMIGELLKREADLAIGDLSITSAREEVVDFTMPFMNLGISILFKKPEKQAPPMFSFLEPLSMEVWFYMGTAYLGVSLFLFILARLSPYEWVNPHPCDVDNDVVENQFTLLNSFWFTIGSIMQQGSDILPRAISTRIVASSWWFFTLIMISSYTANLAAFLTAQRMTSPIESASDLAKQTTIQYGSLSGGSTMGFFRDSSYPVYKRMWAFMESQRPSVFTENNDKGIERVRMGNYAFLMESASIEYQTERKCDLVKIGGELDQKGYGIATPPGSPYRSVLSGHILELQENQQLQAIKDKWWKPEIRCPDDTGSSSAEMGIRNVGGVFLVLGIGSCLGTIIVVMEFVWKANKMLNRGSIASMLWHELRSTLTCRGSTRPAPQDPDEPSVEKVPMVSLGKADDYKFS